MAHPAHPNVPTPRADQRPYWSAVLRALRDARGLTQEVWAGRIGYSRATIRRWEAGESIPDAVAERAIIAYCADEGLFRTYDEGILRGQTLAPAWIESLLTRARSGGATTAESRADDTAGARLQVERTPPSSFIDVPGNLPLLLTDFIGRTSEQAAVVELLSSSRLVTLSGPGGSGKTRLSLQVAGAEGAGYSDGVWLVELASLADPGLVIRAVATVVGLREVPDDEIEAVLIRYFRARRCLLILDNCEHLIDPSARLAATLIGSCPTLTILSTSREPLHIPGETVFPVPPLSLPDPATEPTVASVRRSEAVQLFLARATMVRPTFRMEPGNARTVAEICRRLDGIPLALELAAARIKLLSPDEIAERLSNRFRLLTSSSAVILPRHQTLRAAIDWSYDLLTEQERACFNRLSVLPGGWTVGAAEAICAGDGIEADDVLDLLGELVDKSLVTTDEHNGVLRYRLFESIREYASEKLNTSGELDASCQRRESWLTALAEQPPPEREGPELTAYLLRLDADADNFRAALAWRIESGGGLEAGLRLAAALGPFWEGQGGNAEGLRWLDRFLQACPDPPTPLRAAALFQTGKLAFWSGDYDRAVAILEESMALFEQLNDRREGAAVRYWLANTVGLLGKNQRSNELLYEALARYQTLGDRLGVARMLRELALGAMFDGDIENAEALCNKSLALYREMGDHHGMAQPLSVLVRAMFVSRQYERAAAFAEQAIAISAELGSRQFRANVLVDAGMVQSALGHPDRALELERESLRLVRDSGTKLTIHMCLGAIGAALSRAGESERGARMLSASVALLDSMHAPIAEAYRPMYEATKRSIERRMDPEIFAAAWEAGRMLSLDDAIAEALDEQHNP
jgi:non-specific serine/threonine protein kinase